MIVLSATDLSMVPQLSHVLYPVIISDHQCQQLKLISKYTILCLYVVTLVQILNKYLIL